MQPNVNDSPGLPAGPADEVIVSSYTGIKATSDMMRTTTATASPPRTTRQVNPDSIKLSFCRVTGAPFVFGAGPTQKIRPLRTDRYHKGDDPA